MYRIPKIVRGVRRVLIKLCPNYHHFTLFPSYISYIVSLYLLLTLNYYLLAGRGVLGGGCWSHTHQLPAATAEQVR